jgi:hypothetical protein
LIDLSGAKATVRKERNMAAACRRHHVGISCAVF